MAAEAAYGYSRDELLQLDIYQLCAAGSRPMVREQMKATEAEGVLFEAEHRRKDGSLFPVEVSSRGTTFVDDDEVLLSVIRDVSERKGTEEALRHSEERYHSHFEDSPTAMWEEDHSAVKAHLEELIASGVTDVAGYLLTHPLEYERCVVLARTLDVNRAAVALFEASSHDELLERVDELHPPGVVGGLRLFWAAMLAGERSASFDETNVTLTGRELLLLETCTVAPGHEQTFDRVYLVDADVTDRHRAEERLRLTLKAAVAALGATTELRDPYTAGHQRRVAELAGAIAAELGWSEEQIETLRIAALLHDIGKIVVPAEILAKPGRLTELEMELVRQHAQAGAATIAHIDFGDAIAAAIAQHHERLDGSGYPAGLTGDQILPGARILAVADVVEAMMSHRPYRPAQPTEAALAEIEAGAGRIYDAACCEAVLRLFREQGFTFLDG